MLLPIEGTTGRPLCKRLSQPLLTGRKKLERICEMDFFLDNGMRSRVLS